jgi:hypothetical protein
MSEPPIAPIRLLGRHIGRKTGSELGFIERQESVRWREDWGNGCARRRILDQRGDRLTSVRGKRGDVDEPTDAGVSAGFGDDRSTV